ncbi:MAG TPA: cysteine--tRNA ligase, partial [Ilumatobacter sp.]
MSNFRLYDTSRQAIVPFQPNEHVLMYTCGITPYDATHLGHAATFLAYDVLQRRLIDRGHTVTCVRNVTDVDDPLFAKARQLGIHYLDLAAGEEARFEADMEA